MSTQSELQEILKKLNRKLGEAKRFQSKVSERILNLEKEIAKLKADHRKK